MDTDKIITLHLPSPGKIWMLAWIRAYQEAMITGQSTVELTSNLNAWLNECRDIGPIHLEHITITMVRSDPETQAHLLNMVEEAEKRMREEAHVWFGIDRGKPDDERGHRLKGLSADCAFYDDMPEPTQNEAYEGGKKKAQWKRERNGRYGR